jgi:hypothetical protein
MSDVRTEVTARERRTGLIQSVRLPPLSGKASAACLLACFALTGALVPMAVRLPLWVDFELVLAAWWLIWGTVLSWLLYRGRHVSDDHSMATPRRWFGSDKRTASAASTDLDWLGCADWLDLRGCMFNLLLLLACAALIGVA